MPKNVSQLDSFENIRLRLLANGILSTGDSCHTVRVTSRLRGEGVTTVCIGLAQAAAKRGGQRVLVVDAASGEHRLLVMLNLVAEPLASKSLADAAVRSHIVNVKEMGFDVLPLQAGAVRSELWPTLWQELKDHYELILIDVGALVSDGSHDWRPWIDRTILIVDPDGTSYEALQSFRSELEASNVSLDGFIMNKRRYPIPTKIYRLIS